MLVECLFFIAEAVEDGLNEIETIMIDDILKLRGAYGAVLANMLGGFITYECCCKVVGGYLLFEVCSVLDGDILHGGIRWEVDGV